MLRAKDSWDSPSLPQRSDNAANESLGPSTIRCHSDHLFAGTRHQREWNAAPDDASE